MIKFYSVETTRNIHTLSAEDEKTVLAYMEEHDCDLDTAICECDWDNEIDVWDTYDTYDSEIEWFGDASFVEEEADHE